MGVGGGLKQHLARLIVIFEYSATSYGEFESNLFMLRVLIVKTTVRERYLSLKVRARTWFSIIRSYFSNILKLRI